MAAGKLIRAVAEKQFVVSQPMRAVVEKQLILYATEAGDSQQSKEPELCCRGGRDNQWVAADQA